ncbi:YdiU family protein [Georgenia sp. MJ173]|uniref:protein adenylyltransferase SelO n=1 Tax=Georgenia sunbinii TaxID=3117728 RepID=UPI002F2614D7
MSTTAPAGLALGSGFARELPEMAAPWRAAEVPDPRLLVLNEPLAAELGIDPDLLRSDDGARLLTGNHLPDGATPVAQAYAGHQFGVPVPVLGDGRALLLGELTDTAGGTRDLHLKGSGPTPFARGGDGFAAVGPMLREYIVSEALHALGVPTTRSLAVVATGRPVYRETTLPGAVLARVASSHLRVGSFQYARATGDADLLRRLADHAIARHHPAAADAANPVLALYEAVLDAQARLIAQWMLVGFVHGVMNTDNTTISGETIDYGPCAFLDTFDPATVFSSIDIQGRYSYGNQPLVAQWNLARLAEALLPLIDEDEDDAAALVTASLQTFPHRYSAAWTAGMRRKLGLQTSNDEATNDETTDDDAAAVVSDLAPLLTETRPDHITFFRRLASAARGDTAPVLELTGDAPGVTDWLDRWRRLQPDAAQMDAVNPVYIPRNHLVEEALDAATAGDLEPVDRLLDAVTRPYDVRPGLVRYAEPGPAAASPYVTYCGT